MPSSKRPTLRDVAREANVSHVTVSRVLSGVQVVAPDTAERVRNAIKRTGYRPDPALSALAAYRIQAAGGTRGTSALAFLDCDGTKFSREVFAGVRAEAALHGYSVSGHSLPDDESGQGRLSRVLYHRGARGLCFGPSEVERDFRGWNWDEFACVSLGALTHRPVLHAVAPDYFGGAFSGCRALLAQGCRRVGFAVRPDLEARTGHQWLGGYITGLDGRPPHVCKRELSATGEFQRWLRQKRIDGLLTIHADLWRAWRPRKDENVYFLNSTDQVDSNAVNRLRLDPGRIGVEGVRLLHHLLLRREYGLPDEPRVVTLRGRWTDENPKGNDGSRRKGPSSSRVPRC